MEEFTKEHLLALRANEGRVELGPRYSEYAPAVMDTRRNRPIRQLQPDTFELETTTVWSFPQRGQWATHRADYRGNWAPQVPRNLILRYTTPGELVLDPMCGSGTTLIECRLLGRNGIGVDVNPAAVAMTRAGLDFPVDELDERAQKAEQRTFVGDARNLDQMRDESVDLIAAHPPYANIIPYSHRPTPNDLSRAKTIEEFLRAMRDVSKEFFRVLKPGRVLAILMGDTRRKQTYVPLAYHTMQTFLDQGFLLKEDIIKHQWNCQTTPFWKRQSVRFNFHLIMHEHLFIFRKPG